MKGEEEKGNRQIERALSRDRNWGEKQASEKKETDVLHLKGSRKGKAEQAIHKFKCACVHLLRKKERETEK